MTCGASEVAGCWSIQAGAPGRTRWTRVCHDHGPPHSCQRHGPHRPRTKERASTCAVAVDTPRALMRSLSGSALVAFEAPSQTCTCRCASIQGSRARERSILGVAQVVVTLSKRGQLCLNLVGRQFCEFQVVVSHDTRLRARAPRNTREGALGRLLAPCKDDQCRAFPRRCANHAAPPSQSGRHSIQKGTQRRLRRVRRGAPSVRTSMSVAFKSEPRTFCMQARAS